MLLFKTDMTFWYKEIVLEKMIFTVAEEHVSDGFWDWTFGLNPAWYSETGDYGWKWNRRGDNEENNNVDL